MTSPRPPWFALVVLRALRVDDESLVGDLVEEFGARRLYLWLWLQVLGAVLAGPEARRRTGPLGLCDARFAQSFLRPTPRREPRINLSGGPVPGIGGLTVLALVFHVALVSPQLLWLPVFGLTAGSLMAVALVARHPRRSRGRELSYVGAARVNDGAPAGVTGRQPPTGGTS